MSRDSSRSYLHLHSPRFADLMEDFTSPLTTTTQNDPQPTNTTTSTTHIPHDDIQVPPHLMPPNLEDEDEVVPNQHAVFGISRAMAAREGRERQWKDFGTLEGLVRGIDLHAKDGKAGGGVVVGGSRGGGLR
ncbi:MAG: hypothetical protein M1828_007601 [Chrysothrix sp. TS-e1954]|nr:MAG: hypothetical protein M1828_007601 [Chrysothrix sp. TS-e1954]